MTEPKASSTGSHVSSSDITDLLQQWRKGDKNALDRLMPLVYAELRHVAARYVARERPENTLRCTALVHEAFLRLVDQRRVDWQSRAHFYGLAAQMMRRILVDRARRTGRSKRGSGVVPVPLDEASLAVSSPGAAPIDVLALDDALRALAVFDEKQARLVELRFFGGLTFNEAAETLGLSSTGAKREWALAKAWLYRRLSGQDQPESTAGIDG